MFSVCVCLCVCLSERGRGIESGESSRRNRVNLRERKYKTLPQSRHQGEFERCRDEFIVTHLIML